MRGSSIVKMDVCEGNGISVEVVLGKDNEKRNEVSVEVI